MTRVVGLLLLWLFVCASPVQAQLTSGLVAFWELEEASGSRADSVGSHTLADTNTVTSNPGKVGTAGQFTAANSEYLAEADTADLSSADIDFTVQAWVYLDTKATDQAVFARFQTSGSSIEWLLSYITAADRFRFYASPVGNGTGLTTVNANNFGAVSTGTWYLLHAWHDSVNNLIGISVNGGTANTTAYSGGLSNTAAFTTIGLESVAGALFNGRIDQVGYWRNRVLSSGDRTALYNGGAGLSYLQMQSAVPAGMLLLGVGR